MRLHILKPFPVVLRISAGLIILSAFVLVGCDDDFEEHSPDYELQFSEDTVLFDTIFTETPSITQQFKVQNPHSKDIQISSIELGQGQDSYYRINVDGKGGTSFDDFTLGAEDSIFVFVDLRIDQTDKDNPFIVRDSVRFVGQDGLQDHVKLMAWGQDARFYRNEAVCDETWDERKPYVVFNSIIVPEGCRLDIEPGTNIHSHFNSSILVQGTMEAIGEPDQPITFTGDRLDDFHEDRPGQWIGIRFLAGSRDNIMNHTKVTNGVRGIQVDSLPVNNNPNLILQNSVVQNMNQIGVLGNTAHINFINSVISDCGQHLFAGVLGGEYEFFHTTLSNPSIAFAHDNPSFIANNADFDPDEGSGFVTDLSITMVNSILWGTLDNELGLVEEGDGELEVNIASNLLKTQLDELEEFNMVNEDPKFEEPSEMNYRLRENSPAIEAGREDLGIDTDIEGNSRKDTPDLGAYESDF